MRDAFDPIPVKGNSLLFECLANKKRTDIEDEVLHLLKECSAPDWDGYNAHPINTASAAHVLLFLNKLPANITQPDLVPEPTGNLAMDWGAGYCRLIVSVDELNHLTFHVWEIKAIKTIDSLFIANSQKQQEKRNSDV